MLYYDNMRKKKSIVKQYLFKTIINTNTTSTLLTKLCGVVIFQIILLFITSVICFTLYDY